MHKLIRVLTSRLFLIAFLVALQFLLIVAFVYNISFAPRISFLLETLGFIIVIFVNNRNMDPAYKIGWITVVLGAPIIGVPMYILFGDRRLSNRLYEGMVTAINKLKDTLTEENEKELYQELKGDPQASIMRYVSAECGFPVYKDSDTKYYPSGEEWFPDYLDALRSAKHFIFIEMFIIDYGSVWTEVLDILKQKALEGVDVKLIYDDFGAVTMHAMLFKELREVGIDAYAFNRLRPRLIIQMNNRDHRKITIIDNQTGFVGGVNLADEYVNRVKRFGYWRDSALRIQGPAVQALTAQFLGMYHYLSDTANQDSYDQYMIPSGKCEAEGYVQPFADTPTDEEFLSMSVHLNMINNARDYIYINTPYLILNDAVSRALKLAAGNGVDVRILTPHIPDKQIVFQCTQKNYYELLKAGVKIYEFTPGFNHSKAIVADDKYGLVGSINTDFRSYFLHFENGVLLYKTKTVIDIRRDFEKALLESHEVSLEEVENTNIFLKLFRAVMNTFVSLV